jgi:hypothetical protein
MSTNNLFTEKEVLLLDYTISTREQIIKSLIAEGKAPDKTSDKVLLTQLLDGMDRAIHTKAKLKIDSSTTQQQEQTTAMLGELLRRIDPKDYVSQSHTVNNNREIPSAILVTDRLPGEMDIAPVQLTYESFVSGESSSG